MVELASAEARARALMTTHLDASWTFGFDRARARAGACNWTTRRITVSRALTPDMTDDELDQVLLHEIAHALAGHEAGHGPRWRAIARGLGYTGGRTHTLQAVRTLAPWQGRCPAGHEHVRFRAPTRPLSCARCSPRFQRAHLIRWERADESRREAS